MKRGGSTCCRKRLMNFSAGRVAVLIWSVADSLYEK